MSNCGLALLGLAGSLEGDRPNQVVALHGVIAWNCLAECGDGQTGVGDLYRPLSACQQKTTVRIAERGMESCRAA
jgi:hypothetical protein